MHMHTQDKTKLLITEADAPHLRRDDPFLISQLSTGHPFLLSRGIRGHPFPKTWEWRGIRFEKMGIRFSKTPFLEGIKRMQLLLLKLKKATQENTTFRNAHLCPIDPWC